MLHNTGIATEQLMRLEQPVEAEQPVVLEKKLCLISNVLNQCDLTPKQLGTELAKGYSFTNYGMFGYAIMSSTTLHNYNKSHASQRYIIRDPIFRFNLCVFKPDATSKPTDIQHCHQYSD